MARATAPSRAVRWLVLLAHGLVVSGLPLPIAGPPPAAGSHAARRLAAKDRARPFPCLDKPCGCSTAEQCFSRCCCNSPAELLAWAKARELEPATLAALERRVVAADAAAAPSSCCAAAECGAAPAADGAASAVDVCDDSRSLATRPAEGGRRVSLMAMLACDGVLEGFLAAATALPPPKQCSAAPAMPLVATLVIADDAGCSVDRPRDTPPPRS